MYGTNSILMRAKLTRGQLKWVDANKKRLSPGRSLIGTIAWLFNPMLLYLLYQSYIEVSSPAMDNFLVFGLSLSVLFSFATFLFMVIGAIALGVTDDQNFTKILPTLMIVYPLPEFLIKLSRVISWLLVVLVIVMSIYCGYILYSVVETLLLVCNLAMYHVVMKGYVDIIETWVPDLNKERVES